MLVALTCAALAASWLGLTMKSQRTQRDAVAKLQQAGGSILYNYQSTGERSWARAAVPQGPKWLRELLGPEYFDKPVFAWVSPLANTKDWAESINRLPTIRTLYLHSQTVDDEMMALLDGSPQMFELQLMNASISNATAAGLAKYPNLRWLTLSGSSVTDSFINSLAAPALKELHLDNTPTSDAAIPALVKMRSLKRLVAFETNLTEAGVRKLQKQRPDVVLLIR